jgi:uncharacterized cupin superfamily protein
LNREPDLDTIAPMAHPNVFQSEFEYDPGDPPGYRCGQAYVGRQAGGREESVRLYEMPPGEHLCPYHYEYVEEWLLVLQGQVELRTSTGEETLLRGALACFPPGPEGAHKLTNRSETRTVVMMWSSAREPAVAVYPDSDKIGVWPGGERDRLMVRRADGQVPYYDGEA